MPGNPRYPSGKNDQRLTKYSSKTDTMNTNDKSTNRSGEVRKDNQKDSPNDGELESDDENLKASSTPVTPRLTDDGNNYEWSPPDINASLRSLFLESYDECFQEPLVTELEKELNIEMVSQFLKRTPEKKEDVYNKVVDKSSKEIEHFAKSFVKLAFDPGNSPKS